jgi:putative transposase
MVVTAIRQIFRAETANQAREHLCDVDRLQAPAPKVARLLDDAAEEPLAYYQFSSDPWPRLQSTNPLERVNKETGRRSDVVGIYPKTGP